MGWIVDVVLIIMILLSTALSVKKGIVNSLCSSFGSIFAAVLAVITAMPIADGFVSVFNAENLYWVFFAIAAVMLLLLFAVLIKQIGKRLTNFIDNSKILKVVNKVLGGVFGLIFGCALAFLGMMIAFAFVCEEGVTPNETICSFLQTGFLGNLIYTLCVSA